MEYDDIFLNSRNLPMPLSNEEARELIKKAQNGDKTAVDILVKHNLKLIFFEINTWFKFLNYDKKDLVATGAVGLMKAINSFDLDKNYAFNTYAIRCIDNEILMLCRKLKNNKNILSLSDAVYCDANGEKFILEDTISSDADVAKEFSDFEYFFHILKYIEKLPEREKKMIIMRFGLDNYDETKNIEIAKKYNISTSYVSRTINKNLRKLRIMLLKEYKS